MHVCVCVSKRERERKEEEEEGEEGEAAAAAAGSSLTPWCVSEHFTWSRVAENEWNKLLQMQRSICTQCISLFPFAHSVFHYLHCTPCILLQKSKRTKAPHRSQC